MRNVTISSGDGCNTCDADCNGDVCGYNICNATHDSSGDICGLKTYNAFNGGDSNDDICRCRIYNMRNSDSPSTGKSTSTLMTGKVKEGDGIPLNEQVQPL